MDAAPTPSRGCPDCEALRAQVAEMAAELEAHRMSELLRAGLSEPDGHANPGPIDAFGLRPRQWQVLELIALGKSNAEIAEELFLGINTIKTHVQRTYRTIGVTNRTTAALWFLHHQDQRFAHAS